MGIKSKINNIRAKIQARKEEREQKSYNKAVAKLKLAEAKAKHTERLAEIKAKIEAARMKDPRVKARAARRAKLKKFAKTAGSALVKFAAKQAQTQRRSYSTTTRRRKKTTSKKRRTKRRRSGNDSFRLNWNV